MTSVLNIRKRLPDFVNSLDTDCQSIGRQAVIKRQSLVLPPLPKIALKRVFHIQLGDFAHAANKNVHFDLGWLLF
jgi:hypothetical protein